MPLNIPKDFPEDEMLTSLTTGAYTYPNVLNQQYVVSGPDHVWTADLVTISDHSSGSSMRIAETLIVTDLGDGRIVAHLTARSIQAGDVVRLLSPHFEVFRHKYGIHRPLLFHVDRGGQFTSGVYHNLAVLYPNVMFSQSLGGTPTDNSVSERTNRTIVRNSRFWAALGYGDDPYKLVFKDGLKEVISAIDQIVRLYNSTAKVDRSLNLTPEGANWAFTLAAKEGLIEPQIKLTWNLPKGGCDFTPEAYAEIIAYREQVKMLAQRDILSPPDTAQEAATRFAKQLAIIQDKQIEAVRLDMAKNKAETDQRLDNIEYLLQNPKKAVRPLRSPRQPRTPFGVREAKDLATWCINEKRTITDIRNAIGALIMFGTGVPCKEVLWFTHQNIQDLLSHRCCTVYSGPRWAHRKRWIANPVALQLKRLYVELVDIFNAAGYNYSPESLIISDYTKPDFTKPLDEKHFNAALNKTLEEFSGYYSSRYGKAVNFRAFSGRIGFVQQLLKAGIDSSKIQDLAGLKDPRSLKAYGAPQLSASERQQLVDQAFEAEPE